MSVDDIPVIKTEKLCPLRKITYFYTFKGQMVSNIADAESFEEEFQPCLKENCAVYNTSYMSHFCGFRQK